MTGGRVTLKYAASSRSGSAIEVSNWIYLAAAIVAEVIATSFLKASEGFSKLFPSLLVVAGYGTAFFCLSLTLRTIPVGIAYAIWSGVGVVLVTIAGRVFYGQRIDAAGITGILLIILGVLVIHLWSKTAG